MFPKRLLPATSTIKEKQDEEDRRGALNEKEAERLANLLENDGTITRITNDWMKKLENATQNFSDRK